MKLGRPTRTVPLSSEGTQTLGAYLLRARRLAKDKLNQESAANAAGVTRVAISDYERDVYQPNAFVLAKLLALYGIDPAAFPFDVPVDPPYARCRSGEDITPSELTKVAFSTSRERLFLSDAIRQLSAVERLLKDCGGGNVEVELISIEVEGGDLRVSLRTVEVGA